MTVANISMGSEVRFTALWKTRLYHFGIFLSEPEPLKNRHSLSILYHKGFWRISHTETYHSERRRGALSGTQKQRRGITQRDLPIKACTPGGKKRERGEGQWGGGVRVWRSLFLASEKSGVCGQWKRKGSVGKVTWSSAVAFILHDPCESESAARVGGWGRTKHKQM